MCVCAQLELGYSIVQTPCLLALHTAGPSHPLAQPTLAPLALPAPPTLPSLAYPALPPPALAHTQDFLTPTTLMPILAAGALGPLESWEPGAGAGACGGDARGAGVRGAGTSAIASSGASSSGGCAGLGGIGGSSSGSMGDSGGGSGAAGRAPFDWIVDAIDSLTPVGAHRACRARLQPPPLLCVLCCPAGGLVAEVDSP